MNKKRTAIIIGILGMWLAGILGSFYINWQLSFLPPMDCSGMNPCKDEEYSIYGIGFSLAGFTGAVFIGSLIQYLANKKVRLLISVLFGIIGAVIWPIVGIIIFLVMLIPLGIMTDIPALTKQAPIITLFFALAVCGAGIGRLVFWLMTKNQQNMAQ